MDGSWSVIENEILSCLRGTGAMTPDELGRRLGFSEGAAVSFLSVLAREGKVRIRLVEVSDPGRSERR